MLALTAKLIYQKVEKTNEKQIKGGKRVVLDQMKGGFLGFVQEEKQAQEEQRDGGLP